MIDFTRRQAVVLAFGAVLADTRAASAQNANLSDRVASAFQIQALAVDANSDRDIANFVTQEFFSRQATVDVAIQSEIFINYEKANAYLESIIGSKANGVPDYYFLQESIEAQMQAVSFVASAGVSLVPNRQDIQPIGVPVAEPPEKKSEETDFGVILEIALETMGIFEGKDLSDKLLSDNDLSAILKEIAPSLKAKDWKNLLALAEKMFIAILASSAFKIFVEKISKRVAFKFALRCLPIVGWTYVAACFLIALKANYHKFSFA